MKKFQFRLERVLRFHQQRLKQAELQVAQAAMEREAARSSVDQCLQEIDSACALNERVGSLINPTARSNVTAHVEQLAKILATAQERLKVAEQRFREKDHLRAEISKDAEGLSLLRNQERSEHHEEVIRQQQIDLDEVVMRKWSGKSDDAPPTTVGLLE